MLRCALLFLIVTGLGWSQFSELAATADGQHLYFTSPLRLSGSASPAVPEYRIFHLGPDGLELFAERGALTPGGDGSFGSSSSDGVTTPQVSADGGVIGFTARNVCPQENPCQPVLAEALLRGARNADLGPGTLQLSHNGRYAVVTRHDFSNGAPSDSAVFIDLETSRTDSIPVPAGDTGMVASNGAVFVRDNSHPWFTAVGLWRDGVFTPVTLTGATRPVALSNDAGTLVFVRISTGGSTPRPALVAKSLVTGSETILYTSNGPDLPNFLGMSDDGRLVLFNVWSGQAAGAPYLANTLTGVSRPIVLDQGEIATAGTLCGRGTAAFLATSTGRIVRAGINGGIPASLDTVVPATPYVAPSYGFAAGSMVRLGGTLPHSVEALSGNILLGGQALPILYVSADEIRAQVPWEETVFQVALTNTVPSDSPFRQNDLVMVPPLAPRIESAGPGQKTLLGLKLIKSDFSGLVTATPAPGDILIAYFTGLGPVNGSPQTGVPAPSDVLFPILGTLTCRFLPQPSPMETLFAGLAPGMTGIYQVAFRVPADAGAAPVTGLACNLQTGAGSGGFTVIGTGAP